MSDPMDIDPIDPTTNLSILKDKFARCWPCLLKWEHQEQGRTITGGLSGLNEMLIVLRRMYVHDISLMSLGTDQDNALLQLSRKPLESLKADDALLLKVVLEQLGRSLCIDKDPPFTTVLHHETMATFWAAPSMRFTQSKILQKRSEDSQWVANDFPDWKNLWNKEIKTFKGDKSIGHSMSSAFETRTRNNIDMLLCCNFPAFMRVKYSLSELSDGVSGPKYEDLQSFDLIAPRLSEDDVSKPGKNPVQIMVETHHYSLIACVFERNNADDISEVRTWMLTGGTCVPYTWWRGGWTKRMGTSKNDCFLFYTKCRPQKRFRAREFDDAAPNFHSHKTFMIPGTPDPMAAITQETPAMQATQPTISSSKTPKSRNPTTPVTPQMVQRQPTTPTTQPGASKSATRLRGLSAAVGPQMVQIRSTIPPTQPTAPMSATSAQIGPQMTVPSPLMPRVDQLAESSKTSTAQPTAMDIKEALEGPGNFGASKRPADAAAPPSLPVKRPLTTDLRVEHEGMGLGEFLIKRVGNPKQNVLDDEEMRTSVSCRERKPRESRGQLHGRVW